VGLDVFMRGLELRAIKSEAIMTPDFDGWGRVLQLFSPEDVGRKMSAAPRRTPGGGRRTERLGPSASAESDAKSGASPPGGVPDSKSPARKPTSMPVHPRILDRQMQTALGRHLRAMFDDVANEPVPDKFVQLLQDLENKEKQR
jgi:hypothetical protein